MKKKCVIALMASISTAVIFSGSMVMAAPKMPEQTTLAMSSAAKPILIIRFNQPGVVYQPSVKKVVKKVQEINPSAMFKVISTIPLASDVEMQQENQKLAEYNGKKIVEALQKEGVAAERITLSYDKKQVATNEVAIAAQ